MASVWDNQYELAPMTSSGHKSGKGVAVQSADDRTKVENWECECAPVTRLK
jgi:hypothetical protein